MVFHTFTPPADRSVRLLVKNLGRTMPIDDIMEELQSSGIEGVAVTQLRSSRRDQDPAKDRQPTPHFIVTVARGPMVAKLRALEVLCGLTVKVETYNAPKGPLQCKHCQRFGHTRRNCGHSPRCVACGEEHASGTCKTPREDIRCCNCKESHTANYKGCPRYKDAKTTRKTGPTRKAPKASRKPAPRPSPEQEALGPEWSHVTKGGKVLKPSATGPSTSHPSLPPPSQGATVAAKAATAGPMGPAKQRTASRPLSQAVKPDPPPHPLSEIEDLIQDLEPALCRRLTRC